MNTNFVNINDILEIEKPVKKEETVVPERKDNTPSAVTDLSFGNIVYIGAAEDKNVNLIMRRFPAKNQALAIRIYPGKEEKGNGRICMETNNSDLCKIGFQYSYTDLSELRVVNEGLITERITAKDPFIFAPILNSFMNQCHIDNVRNDLKKEVLTDEEFTKYCQPSANRMEVLLPLARYAKSQKDRADALTMNLTAAQKSKQKMKKERDAFEKELRQYVSSKKSAQQLVKEKSEKVRTIADENEGLKKELEAEHDKNDHLHTLMDQAKDEKKVMLTKLQDSAEEVAALQSEISTLNQKITEKDTLYTALQQEYDELKTHPTVKAKTYYLTPDFPKDNTYSYCIKLPKDMQEAVKKSMEGIPEYLISGVYAAIFENFMAQAKDGLVNFKVSMDIPFGKQNSSEAEQNS